MNVLAARVASLERGSSKLTGSICINGKARDDESFRRISAYVLQVSDVIRSLLIALIKSTFMVG
jgi:hypothetical protein